MTNRTDEPPDQPSPAPVDTDANATSTQLLGRAADDYATAQRRREQLSREDRVHGNEQEGAR